MVSLLAGAANTPISASIMAMELFGPQVAPYAAVSCVISFLMTGHRSVYPSQILSMSKSSSLAVKHGQEMKHIEGIEYEPRERSLLGIVSKSFKKFRGRQ
jgi:H+/Cl- antiporter ClcA